MSSGSTQRVALILGEPDDPTVAAVGLALHRRGCPLVRAGIADLALARWQHSPNAPATSIVLPDGRQLDDARIGVVFNRLGEISLPQFANATSSDRSYAQAEFSALLASWLNGLEALVANPPVDGNSWSPTRHPLAWHALAAAQGLPVGDFAIVSSLRGGGAVGLERIGSSGYPRGSDLAGWYRRPLGEEIRWLRVFGDQCCAEHFQPDAALRERCCSFVRATKLRYAALGFAEGADGPRLVEFDAAPPLAEARVAASCAAWLQSAMPS